MSRRVQALAPVGSRLLSTFEIDSILSEDGLNLYRDCASDIADIADSLTDLALRYEEQMIGDEDES